jgi:hypothetical protein
VKAKLKGVAGCLHIRRGEEEKKRLSALVFSTSAERDVLFTYSPHEARVTARIKSKPVDGEQKFSPEGTVLTGLLHGHQDIVERTGERSVGLPATSGIASFAGLI